MKNLSLVLFILCGLSIVSFILFALISLILNSADMAIIGQPFLILGGIFVSFYGVVNLIKLAKNGRN